MEQGHKTSLFLLVLCVKKNKVGRRRYKNGGENATYQRSGENFRRFATAGDQRRDDQQNRGKKETGYGQVERRLSQIIGRSRTVVILTGADKIVVDVLVFRQLAPIKCDNSSLKRKKPNPKPTR